MHKNLGVDIFPEPIGHLPKDGHPPKEKKCSDQKTYLAQVEGSAQKPRGRHISRDRWPFWGPLAAILNVTGGAAVQVVSECPHCRQAGIYCI